MNLNQLYHDHQLSLMRAKAAPSDASGVALRIEASLIAGEITRIHRMSGAGALRNWERTLAA